MPVKFIKYNNSTIIGVWEIIETDIELLNLLKLDLDSKNLLNNISNYNRRCHWLAYRALLNCIFGRNVNVSYDKSGKPFIKNINEYISVSHAGKYAAAIVSEKPCGIDIEQISPRILKVTDRFLSKKEFESVSESEKPDKLYIYWCAKEAVFKLYGDKILEFNEEILIDNFDFADKGIITARIKHQSINDKILLNFEKIENYYLAWGEKNEN